MNTTTGKILVIAEKPSMGKDIARVMEPNAKAENGCVIGEKYVITWAIGHLVSLCSPKAFCENPWDIANLPIVPTNFRYETPSEPGKKAQFNKIKDLLYSCSSVINACDAGREGEAIFRYIVYEACNYKKPAQRLWINSLTDKAIKDGFDNLKPINSYDNLYSSAVARDQADWIIGMGVGTPALTNKVRKAIPDPTLKWISVGRVFTPTFAMVCKRYLENTNFKPIPFFQIKANFAKNNINFSLTSANNYPTKIDAANLISILNQNPNFTITQITKSKKEENPPLLFDLTSLQQEANKSLGFTADQTLKTAQLLYEGKVITYPRTDSKYINEDIFPLIPSLLDLQTSNLSLISKNPAALQSYIKSLIHSNKLNKRSVDGSKVSDHHAIIPTETTQFSHTPETLGLFKLILKRTFEAFSEKCIKDITLVEAISNQIEFKTKGSTIVSEGFRIFSLQAGPNSNSKNSDSDSDSAAEEENESTTLPELQQNESLKANSIDLLEKATKPKPLYTEASLLAAMENCGNELESEDLKKIMRGSGIGTPATRSSIIEKLFSQEMVTRNKKNLVPSNLGLWLYSYIQNLNISSAELTGEWEFKLEQIKKGELQLSQFQSEIKNYAQKLTSEILSMNVVSTDSINNSFSEKTYHCPKCKTGTIRKGDKSWYCSSWNHAEKPCSFSLFKEVSGKKLSEGQLTQLLEKGKTDVIKGFSKKADPTQKFDAPLILNEEFKLQFYFEPKGEAKTQSESKFATPCPKCNSQTLIATESKITCSNQPCNFSIWTSFSHKKLTNSELTQILTNKKTTMQVTGLKTKTGKTYSSIIVLDPEFKLSFPPR